MNDVEELKKHVLVHARGQRIPDHRRVLGDITSDDGAAPGSWVGEWTAWARSLEARGRLLDACRCYGLARFPFVDGPERREAAANAIGLFDRWRRGKGIEDLVVPVNGGEVRCWTSGLSAVKPLPVLLITGGIVTPKEQWGPVLAGMARLGMAGVVTEMPGVGENTVSYDAKSRRMYSAILDAISGLADTSRAYAMALSFSGHLALRCAVEDPRIRGVVTAGAPIRRLFSDTGWQRGLPRVTRDCLAHLTGATETELPARLAELALTPDQLAALDIPVHYLASKRDEIIPPEDPAELAKLPSAYLVENDDVHGSPSHAMETRLWSVVSVLKMRGGNRGRTAALSALLRVARALPVRP